MRWNYIGDNKYPKDGTYCLCELDKGYVKVMYYSHDGLFIKFDDYVYDHHVIRVENVKDFNVLRWCYIDDILSQKESEL